MKPDTLGIVVIAFIAVVGAVAIIDLITTGGKLDSGVLALLAGGSSLIPALIVRGQNKDK